MLNRKEYVLPKAISLFKINERVSESFSSLFLSLSLLPSQIPLLSILKTTCAAKDDYLTTSHQLLQCDKTKVRVNSRIEFKKWLPNNVRGTEGNASFRGFMPGCSLHFFI